MSISSESVDSLSSNVSSSSSHSDSDSSDTPLSALKPTTRLIMFEYNENDPKRDSGMKMVRLGLARALRPGSGGFRGVLLTSEATRTLSRTDRPLIEQRGLGGVNCSWKKLDEQGKRKSISGLPRLLPFLLAANPTNYGRPWKLNTAEALVAGLHLCGLTEDALIVAAKFAWAAEFFKINKRFLDAYDLCKDEADILQAQSVFTGKPHIIHSVPHMVSPSAISDHMVPPMISTTESHRVPPMVSAVQWEVPLEAPIELQKGALQWMVTVIGAETMGLPKNVSGNFLAKMKRKEFERLWDEHREACLVKASKQQQKLFALIK